MIAESLENTFSFIKAYEAETAKQKTCKDAYLVVADRYFECYNRDRYRSYETFKRILSYHRKNNKAKLAAWKG